jgi:6-phosphogluconolactonase (cycloisomerase 2 family)
MPLTLLLTLFPAAQVLAQGQFTLIDSEAVPGPGDNMVVVERGGARFTITLSVTTDTAYVHRVSTTGEMDLVSIAPTGGGPRAIAMARNGQYAVIANSNTDDLSVMSISDQGVMSEVNRVSSGGDNPFDVAVAYDDLVLVANRDSDNVTLFSIDRRGVMRQVGQPHPAGIDPHVISVSPQGVVAVANSTSNDLTIFDLDRRGNMFLLDQAFPVGNSPKAVAFGTFGFSMFVATRSPAGQQDQIQAYEVHHPRRSVNLVAAGSTPAGVLLTDIEVTVDSLFAVSVNPLTGRDQVRAFDRRGSQLIAGAILETAGPPPSFKNIASAPVRGPIDRILFVSEFQGGWLRSIRFDR